MNETVLSILMVAGVLAIAATLWLAAKSTNAKRTEPAAQAQPDRQQIHPQPVRAVNGPQPARSLVVSATEGATPTLAVPSGENGVPDVLTLLQKAYEQLSSRQHRIESELARIEQLRGEREAVALQADALDQAMKAFAVTPAVSRQIEPYMFEPNCARLSENVPT